jgi:flagellin
MPENFISKEGGDSMIINHNISAEFANRLLRATHLDMVKSIERLSSGMRINKAGDDASGLAVSEKLRSQVRGLLQAARNTEDGISFIQTAEGALQEMHSVLHRVRELAIEASNGIYSAADRAQIQVEVSQLVQEVDRIANTTEFNKFKILDGSQSSLRFHIGANADQNMVVFVKPMTSDSLGVKGVSLSTPEKANKALAQVDSAVDQVSRQRANFGAWQNRLEHTSVNLNVAAENLQAAESRIRDADMAAEMVQFTRLKILAESGTAMLAQANMTPKSVLRLLD